LDNILKDIVSDINVVYPPTKIQDRYVLS